MYCGNRRLALRQVAGQMISVREASSEDAEAVVEIVRRSITQSCTADHRNDPYTLAKWLENKTPQQFVSWLSNSNNFCAVAHLNERLSGVGLLHRGGEVRLFFVAPEAQRQGVGKAIHAMLEEKASLWGLRVVHLQSTALARQFYEALGYRSSGAPALRFGLLQCYPYEKMLLQPSHSLKRTATDGLH
jgi:GNAT superfamily N-acetyltransferase